jgi:competence protein ComEC
MVRTAFQTSNKNFSQFPLLWLAICFACGILAANFVNLTLYFWLAFFLLTAACAWRNTLKSNFSSATLFLFGAFVCAGALTVATEKCGVNANRISRIYDAGQITFETPLVLTGTLQSEPEQTPDGYFLSLQTEKITINQSEQGEQAASGAVRLFLPLDNAAAKRDFENLLLGYGARIKVATRLTREDRYRNPGGAIARDLLKSKNLDASGAIKSLAGLQKMAEAPAFSPLALLYRWRGNLIKQFGANFSTQTAGVLAASLLNNRYFLDKATSNRFREGGTFHVLVISGVHITFIGFLMVWIMRRLTRNVIAQFFAANALLWLYAIAVGAQKTTPRLLPNNAARLLQLSLPR